MRNFKILEYLEIWTLLNNFFNFNIILQFQKINIFYNFKNIEKFKKTIIKFQKKY